MVTHVQHPEYIKASTHKICGNYSEQLERLCEPTSVFI